MLPVFKQSAFLPSRLLGSHSFIFSSAEIIVFDCTLFRLLFSLPGLSHPHRTPQGVHCLSTSGGPGHGVAVVDGASLTPDVPALLPQTPLPRPRTRPQQWLRPSRPGTSHPMVPISSRPCTFPPRPSCSWFQPRVHVSAFTPLSRVPYSTSALRRDSPPENGPLKGAASASSAIAAPRAFEGRHPVHLPPPAPSS